MRNLLIISYDFPPANNIAARRFGYMVKYLEQYGWRPWVITTNSTGPLIQSLEESRVIRIGENSLQSENVENINNAHHLRGSKKIIHDLLRSFGFSLRSVDRYLFSWYKDVQNCQSEILRRIPAVDLVVATYGPASALWLGRSFAKLYGIPWIADFRDLGALYPGWLGRSKVSQWIDISIERYLLSSVKHLMTVSDTLANMLSRTYHKESSVIYNGWDTSDLAVNDGFSAPPPVSGQYMYYAGRFYDHQIDAVKLLLTILKDRGEYTLVIRSLGPKKHENSITEFAEQLGIGHLVKIFPSAGPPVVNQESQQSAVNLVFEDLCTGREWSKGTLTGKLFTLMPMRPPIMCIARADSDTGPVLQKTGKGKLVSSLDDILSFIQDMRSFQIDSFGTDAYEFSRESQAEKAARVFDEIVKDRR